MDPIHPIAPRPPAVLPVASPRPGQVSRDPRKDSRRDPLDRFTKDGEEPEEQARKQARERPRHEPGSYSPNPRERADHSAAQHHGEDDGPAHIDVRA
jgi:hypothetical protein